MRIVQKQLEEKRKVIECEDLATCVDMFHSTRQ